MPARPTSTRLGLYVVAILPILVIYVFFSKYFVASVAASGVKG
jgi:ABC-type glycerol-3-phosphate transport system permease component